MIKRGLKVIGHIAFTGFGFMLSIMAVDVGTHWGRINASVVQGVPYEEAVLHIPEWTLGFIVVFTTAMSFIIIFPVLWIRRRVDE